MIVMTLMTLIRKENNFEKEKRYYQSNQPLSTIVLKLLIKATNLKQN